MMYAVSGGDFTYPATSSMTIAATTMPMPIKISIGGSPFYFWGLLATGYKQKGFAISILYEKWSR
jgi:hypothetical protein